MLFTGPTGESDDRSREPSPVSRPQQRAAASGCVAGSQRFADISGQVISDAAQQQESLIFINMSDASR